MEYLIGWLVCGLIAAIYSIRRDFKNQNKLFVRDLGFAIFIFSLGLISLGFVFIDLFEEYGDIVIYRKSNND